MSGEGLLGAKLDAVLQCMEDMHIEVLAVTEPGCTVGELRAALRARGPTRGVCIAHGPKRASYVVFIVRRAVSLTVNAAGWDATTRAVCVRLAGQRTVRDQHIGFYGEQGEIGPVWV